DIVDRDKASELLAEAVRFQYVFVAQQAPTPRPHCFIYRQQERIGGKIQRPRRSAIFVYIIYNI
ncbi:MAG: hypothetical protein ACM3OG_06845, partial [Actinomycetota bacterium]